MRSHPLVSLWWCLITTTSIMGASAVQFSDTLGLGITFSSSLSADNRFVITISAPKSVAWAGIGVGNVMDGSPVRTAFLFCIPSSKNIKPI